VRFDSSFAHFPSKGFSYSGVVTVSFGYKRALERRMELASSATRIAMAWKFNRGGARKLEHGIEFGRKKCCPAIVAGSFPQ
jgi:hypothetical protein